MLHNIFCMIACPLKQLQAIHFKLTRIQAGKTGNRGNCQQPTDLTLLDAIEAHVDRMFGQLEGNSPLGDSCEVEGEMYGQIEKDLQKQQKLNRLLIKKELEFKEYQKCLEDELKEERGTTKKLQHRVDQYNDKIVYRDMEIAHLSNEKKTLTKERKVKDFLTMDTLLNDKRMTEGIKAFNKEGTPPPFKPNHHVRRRSDDLKRPSTGLSKKKTSVSKR